MKSFRVDRPVTLRASVPFGERARERRVRGHVRSVRYVPYMSGVEVTVKWEGLRRPETWGTWCLREAK